MAIGKRIVFTPWENMSKEEREQFKFANRSAQLRPDANVGDEVYSLTIDGILVGFVAKGGALPPYYFWFPYLAVEISYYACFSLAYGEADQQYIRFRNLIGNLELFETIDNFIFSEWVKW